MQQRIFELDTIRDAGGERADLNVTSMVRAAAESTPELTADHVASTVAAWRQGSAAAHGFHWATLGGHDARQPTAEELAQPSRVAADAVLVPMSSGGSIADLAEHYLAAHVIAAHGWRLIARRDRPIQDTK